MKKITITYAQNTPAYASMELEVPDDASNEQIIEAAKTHADRVGDLVFSPSYDWEDLRIFDIRDATGRLIEEGISLEEPLQIETLSFVARGAEGGKLAFSAKRETFDLVVEAVRAWDEHGHDDDPARTCVIVEGFDDALIERIQAAENLVRTGGLDSAAFVLPTIWGDGLGRESNSKVVVRGNGLVRIVAENARGVYESLDVWVDDVRQAWRDGQDAQRRTRRCDDLVLAGDAQSMDWLLRQGAKVRELWRLERELAGLGFCVETSQSDFDGMFSNDSIEVLGEDAIHDEGLPERVRELAAAWVEVRRRPAQMQGDHASRPRA
jgi:hypothetical protein